MKRKLLAIASGVLAAIACAFAFSACADGKGDSGGNQGGSHGDGEEPHIHRYEIKNADAAYLKSEATCTSCAVYYFSCECGEIGTGTFEFGTPVPHNFTEEKTEAKYLVSEASCMAKAVYHKCCSVCGEAGTETFESGEPLPHKFTNEIADPIYLKSEATCTAKAVYFKCCADCGEAGTETFESGEPLPHKFTNEIAGSIYLKSEATCTDKAVYFKCCEDCGEAGLETFEYGELAPHKEVTDAAVSATCTHTGLTEGKHCSVCNKVLEAQTQTQKLPHKFTQETVSAKYLKSEATCTDKATYFKCCADCGEAGLETFEYGELAPHKEVTDAAVSATCTHTGLTEGKHCSVCDKVLEAQTQTQKLPHKFTQETVSAKYLKSEATCTDKATYFKCCADCGEAGTETFVYGELAPHKEVTDAAVSATCTHTGLTEGKHCSVCDKVLEAQTQTQKLPHKFTQETVSAKYLKSEATCTDKATYFKCCADCGEAGTETFVYGELAPHKEVTDAAVSATCTHTGLTEGKHCSVCNKVLEAQTQTQKLPHKFTQETVSAKYLKSEATCTDKAVYFKCCADCGEVGLETFESGKALGHRLSSKDYKAATCTADGNIFHYYCLRCDAKFKDRYGEEELTESVVISALGHNYPSQMEYNTTRHWNECANCHEKKDISDHDLTHGDCTVCGGENYSEGLKFTLNTSGTAYEVSLGKATDSKIIIPSKYKCLPVNNISESAFENCTTLREVVIPEGITYIGFGAFKGCANLTEIVIPNSLTRMGWEAFYGCMSVERVSVPFLGSEPSNSSGCLGFLFNPSNCGSNMSYYIPECLSSVEITGDCKIYDNAFKDCVDVKYVLLGSGVTSIGKSAFQNCRNLLRITIGENVSSIGDYAFSCDKLVEVYNLSDLDIVKGSYTYGGVAENAKVVHTSLEKPSILKFAEDDFVFYTDEGNAYLIDYVGKETEIALPENYEGKDYAICDYAFRYKSFTSVIISDGVTRIGLRAFDGCGLLATIVIGSEVKEVGACAFQDCSSSKVIYYKGTAEEWNAVSLVGNDNWNKDCLHYYYSSTEPLEDGDFWHYGEDGITPEIWVKEN